MNNLLIIYEPFINEMVILFTQSKRIKKEGSNFPLLKINENGVLTTPTNVYTLSTLTVDQFNEIYKKAQAGKPVVLMVSLYSDEPDRPVLVSSISQRYAERFIYYIAPSIDETSTNLSCTLTCLTLQGETVKKKRADLTVGQSSGWL